MRNKLKTFILISSIIGVLLIVFAMPVFASEDVVTPVTTATSSMAESTTSMTISTTGDRLNDFIEKWTTPIVSLIFGAIGSGVIVVLARTLIKKLTIQVLENTNMSNLERSKNQDEIVRLKAILGDYNNQHNEYLKKIEETIPQMKDEFVDLLKQNEELMSIVNTQTKDFEVLKELLALLITTTPELASNGIATKILNLLQNEGNTSTTNEVGGTNEQNE